MSDERRGYTSASNALADRLCPGRHLAQRGLKEIESAEATQGTLIHAVFAGEKDESVLDAESLKTCKRAKEIESIILGNWLCGLDEPNLAECFIEKRLWNYKGNHCGQPDKFWSAKCADGSHVLLEDLKSLYGKHPDVDENEQVRDYAALIYCNYGVKSVTAFINQPRVAWKVEDVQLVKYGEKDLMRAYHEMNERVQKSNDINSPRIVGEKQCAYCKAAGTSRCPESQRALVTIGSAQFDIANASPEERGDWLGKLKLIEKMAKKAITELTEAIRENGDGYAQGWGLGKAKTTREIDSKNIPKIGFTLAKHFQTFTPEMLAECCKISVPKLEELHEKLSGLKGRERMLDFEILFSDYITNKEQEQPITKIK